LQGDMKWFQLGGDDGCSNWNICSTHPIIFVHPFSHFHSILIPFLFTMMNF
jgi:hypothetical protein